MINFLGAFLGVILLVILLSIFITILFDAPFVPTKRPVIQQLFEVLPISETDVVYDLGSGDGRLLIECVKKFKTRKAVGVEKSLVLAWYSRYEIWRAGLSRQIEIIHQSFWDVNLSEANVVFCFLLPKAMRELKPKLSTELTAGTRVVSFAFSIPDWVEPKIYHFSKNFGKVMVYWAP